MSTTTSQVSTTLLEVATVPTTVRRSGSGRAVLYLHGAFFPTAWTPFHDELAARADLIAPIHPGYAEGHPPDWLRGFDDLVLHYRDLLDGLGVERVDVVGYDLGAWIGAQLAVFHPERIRSFCAISPLGLRVPEAPPFEFLCADPARLEERLFGGPAGEHAHLLAASDDIEAFSEAYGENGVTARLIWARRYDVGLDRRIARITAPSLVVSPTEDRIVPLAHATRWAELLPSGRLVTIDGAGHALVVQEPERVADAITTFHEEVTA